MRLDWPSCASSASRVLLDIVVKCELRAAHRRLLVKSIGGSGQNDTSCRRLRALSHAQARRNECQPNDPQITLLNVAAKKGVRSVWG
jgi:hypothetical protein